MSLNRFNNLSADKCLSIKENNDKIEAEIKRNSFLDNKTIDPSYVNIQDSIINMINSNSKIFGENIEARLIRSMNNKMNMAVTEANVPSVDFCGRINDIITEAISTVISSSVDLLNSYNTVCESEKIARDKFKNSIVKEGSLSGFKPVSCKIIENCIIDLSNEKDIANTVTSEIIKAKTDNDILDAISSAIEKIHCCESVINIEETTLSTSDEIINYLESKNIVKDINNEAYDVAQALYEIGCKFAATANRVDDEKKYHLYNIESMLTKSILNKVSEYKTLKVMDAINERNVITIAGKYAMKSNKDESFEEQQMFRDVFTEASELYLVDIFEH